MPIDLEDLKARLSLAQNKIEIRKRQRAGAHTESEEVPFDKELADDDEAISDEEDGDGGTTSTGTSQQSCFKCIQSALQRPNKTFTNLQVRDIERKNSILMNRIISNNRKPSVYLRATVATAKVANSLVNRKKFQQRIERENKVLLKKIQTVKPFGQSKRKM